MIELNRNNGDITIGQIQLSTTATKEIIKIVKKIHAVLPAVTNLDWETYRMPNIDNDQYSLLLQFHRGLLKEITIGLGEKYISNPFVVSASEEIKISKLLEELGGANDYPWGSVQQNKDIKAGFASILIKYR